MAKSKVFIFGSGFIGNKVFDYLNKVPNTPMQPFEAVMITDRVYSYGDAERAIEKASKEHGEPFAIFNAIGKKGEPNVDWCEDHKEVTFFANTEIPMLLAEAAWNKNLAFVHISTGCIFNGKGPFREDSVPNFDGSYYSYTKKETEARLLRLQEDYPDSYLEMHRIRMPFIGYEDPGNLITKLISYKSIVEAKNSMTYVPDYVEMVAGRLIKLYWEKAPGYKIVNATNPGAMTHKEVMSIVAAISGVKDERTYITPEELDKITRVPRTNCELEASRDGIFRPLDQAFMEAIRSYFHKP